MTNHCIFHDATLTDDERRKSLYEGQIYVYSPRQITLAYARFARDMVREAFGSLDPETAQFQMPVEEYAALLGKLKPAFIHHPESKRYVRAILEEMGCDPDRTCFDVPRLRTSTSHGYLTTGIAYAWHPHRDTWYSAPQCQINIWMPVFELDAANGMAFHPRYWTNPVRNSSNGYNYYVWNQEHRGERVVKLLNHDDRPLPRAIEPVKIDPQVRIICPVGALVFFSGAQLHSSVPNMTGKTRFSVDFRTVHLDDLGAGHGAPNLDAACTGTTLRDFRRSSDLAPVPAELVARYDDETAAAGKLLYDDPHPS